MTPGGWIAKKLPTVRPICDNPPNTPFLMRSLRSLVLSIALGTMTSAALAQPATKQAPATAGAPVLALVGGTVIDLGDWGHSAKDLTDAVVLIHEGHILEIGSRQQTQIPKGARVLDCTGKYLIPGLIDGYAGMNSQSQADAFLYMGVTTVVAVSDAERGRVNTSANPSPHLYLVDSIGSTDNYSLLIQHSGWSTRLRESSKPAELSPEETAHQLQATSHLGTRVVKLGAEVRAANAQWIISHAHQMGMVTYGEFVATPYKVGIEAGVDALPQMGHYELGAVPDELQKPLVTDPHGAGYITAHDYALRIPLSDLRLHNFARFVAGHHAALMPAFSQYWAQLPGHRNPWFEPETQPLEPSRVWEPTDRITGEMHYPVPSWAKKMPAPAQRWAVEGERKKADQAALDLWHVNQAIFSAYPHYLAASGAPVHSSLPGIGLHTELELLVRLGLSPREALAAATSNYSAQFGWSEIGLLAPGRRADMLVVDGDPTKSIWNARRISLLLVDGNPIERENLLSHR